jgi:hypothetical protein
VVEMKKPKVDRDELEQAKEHVMKLIEDGFFDFITSHVCMRYIIIPFIFYDPKGPGWTIPAHRSQVTYDQQTGDFHLGTQDGAVL